MRENPKHSDVYRETYKNAHQEYITQYIKTGDIKPLEDFINNYETNFSIN